MAGFFFVIFVTEHFTQFHLLSQFDSVFFTNSFYAHHLINSLAVKILARALALYTHTNRQRFKKINK